MSNFLDVKSIIDIVEISNIKYNQPIIGLSNQVNSDRLTHLLLLLRLRRACIMGAAEQEFEGIRNTLAKSVYYNKINYKYEDWLSHLTGNSEEENRLKGALKLEVVSYSGFKK